MSAWSSDGTKCNFAARPESDAAALRCNSRKPAHRSEIPWYAADENDSCHHRVIKICPRDILAHRSAHPQKLVQIIVQAFFENFVNLVVAQPFQHLAR